jgi:hypothetical protein
VSGYTKDYAEPRRQWDYWLGTEMKWVRERKLPLFQSTSNHNTYDAGSEAVFRQVHADLPQNGPPGQKDSRIGFAAATCFTSRRTNPTSGCLSTMLGWIAF